MQFMKLISAGRDIIFIENEKEFLSLSSEAKKRLCDRIKGVGAAEIFGIREMCPKTARIDVFDKNGQYSCDGSTASICAVLGLNLIKRRNEAEMHCRNGSFFVMLNDINGKKYNVSCALGKPGKIDLQDITERRTELGNRILTLTHVHTSSDYAVHFSSCPDKLDIEYLSEKTRINSLFHKKARLLIAEEGVDNSFVLKKPWEDGEYVYPAVGAFAAVGVAACKTERSRFSEEIKVSCGGHDVYVFVKNDMSCSVHTTAEFVFCGEIQVE
ncbi:MAG: hypothetical protein E7573_10620 [Ruminococcaceae bacterium]|nr:hypothetical protein [Oscillospiraceae bacterium]